MQVLLYVIPLSSGKTVTEKALKVMVGNQLSANFLCDPAV